MTARPDERRTFRAPEAISKVPPRPHATIEPSSEMERASRVLGKLRFPGESVSSEELARAAWRVAVGKIVASHTLSCRIVAGRLVVEVEDALWMRQLSGMSLQIRDCVNRVLGRDLVKEIEFCVGTPRREAQRARQSTPEPALPDEADHISDPVMRRIYRGARKKAMA